MFIKLIGVAATLATLATLAATSVVSYQAGDAYLDAAVRCAASTVCPGRSIRRPALASNAAIGSAAWLLHRNQVV